MYIILIHAVTVLGHHLHHFVRKKELLTENWLSLNMFACTPIMWPDPNVKRLYNNCICIPR